jgi:hypothetical protein
MVAEGYVRDEGNVPTVLQLLTLESKAFIEEWRHAYRLAGMSPEQMDLLLEKEL